MTDFSRSAVDAALAAELSRAERQIDDAEKAMLHATICFGAARATIANVRAALAQPKRPFRKLALAGPRFDLVQESGRPADHEIERRFLSPQGEGGDDAG